MDSHRWLLFLANVLILHVTIAQYEYIQHLCETNSSYTRNSIYQTNLENVLASLSSTTTIISGFYTLSVGENANKVNLLALCRGDLEPNSCSTCLVNSARDLRQLCSNEKEAIVWYDSCMLRYSNRTISHSLQTEPAIKLNDSSGATNVAQFNRVMRNLLENLRGEAARGSSAMKFATGNMSVGSDNVMIFALVQCTPDLLEWQCNDCLNTIFGELPTCCDGKIGGRVDTPSCQFRYEIERFYDDTLHREVPPPSGAEGRKTVITISASVSASLVVAVLLGFCICYRRRRKRLEKEKQENCQKIQLLDVAGDRIAEEYLGESFPGEINQAKFQDLPLFPLELIRTATQQFSQENKLGEGGFGPVYKGALVDGKEIAVKRLSRNSGQGLQEFKAEVILIARLQHRNLVKLLGCCLEGKELLLVYDYMPNKSLDFFLFDSMRGAQIDWKMRHRIINGIARGMLYLHEDSRLRIIHRDLKSSNVLLDHEMNPKISDFGMARIFGSNQSEANTNRVVGTYGYMAPEYAMKGIFSIKSDVFSFGVLLLEIISGKKNSRFHLSGHGHNLLTFAWKLWSDGQGLELIDLLLKESYVESEVLKCIHIGLLCVQEDPANRPAMSSVVFMMGSDAMTLPQPTEPAFFLGRVVASAQPEPKDIGSSVNEVTLSNVSPR